MSYLLGEYQYDEEGIERVLEAPVGDFLVRMPRRGGSLTICNLGSLLNWIITEQLFPYTNNRGSGRISPKTVKSAFAGVKGDSLGECAMGLHPDENGELKMTLADFHSRLAGFLRRYVAGNMSVRELRTEVAVRIVQDFLPAYQALNSGDPHSTKDKIKNPELTYGPILEKIRLNVSEDCMNLIGDNKWTVLSSIIYSLTSPNPENGDRDWNWPRVYQKRQLAMGIANEKAGYLKIENFDVDTLIEAIDYWFSLMQSLDIAARNAGVNVGKITHNAGLFGFIVCDRMWSEPHFSTIPVMVKKIIRHLPVIQEACPELCRGNRDRVIAYSLKLEEIFKSNRRERERENDAA